MHRQHLPRELPRGREERREERLEIPERALVLVRQGPVPGPMRWLSASWSESQGAWAHDTKGAAAGVLLVVGLLHGACG